MERLRRPASPCRLCRSWPKSDLIPVRKGTHGSHGRLSIRYPLLPSTMSLNPLHGSSPDLASTSSPHGIVTPVQENQEKHTGKAGASWKTNEQQVLPHNRFLIVFPGLMCCVFLAALDQVRSQLCLLRWLSAHSLQQTIVATALPTIVERLGDGKNYSWVGRYPFFLLPCSV